jgi:hypothetical protein
VIRIVNEPSKAVADERKLGPGRPPAPDDAERTPFEGTLSIVRTLTATRSGHEDGHTAYLVGVLGEDKYRLYEIGVFPWAPDEPTRPSMKQMVLPQESYPLCRHTVLSKATLGDVSMSWWMSQPLQVYLDAQMCVQANWRRLACELREGRKASGAECKPMAVGARR